MAGKRLGSSSCLLYSNRRGRAKTGVRVLEYPRAFSRGYGRLYGSAVFASSIFATSTFAGRKASLLSVRAMRGGRDLQRARGSAARKRKKWREAQIEPVQLSVHADHAGVQ